MCKIHLCSTLLPPFTRLHTGVVKGVIIGPKISRDRFSNTPAKYFGGIYISNDSLSDKTSDGF